MDWIQDIGQDIEQEERWQNGLDIEPKSFDDLHDDEIAEYEQWLEDLNEYSQ